jgi:hypothetical protein
MNVKWPCRAMNAACVCSSLVSHVVPTDQLLLDLVGRSYH